MTNREQKFLPSARQLTSVRRTSNLNSLTGLPERLDFLRQVQQLLTEKKLNGWCVLSIDIEHFKLFNNWYGQVQGDELLHTIGHQLAQLAKENDYIAGYFGGAADMIIMRFTDMVMSFPYILLVLVAAVQLFDLSAMIAEKHTAMAETAAKPQPYPQELVDCRDNYGTLMLADDIIHARNVICAAWHPGMVTNGYDVNTYTGAWNVTIDWTAQTSAAVDSGTLDPDTLYVTGDADRFASWQAQYGDKADYITWDIAATGIYDRRDEYYFMAPKQ